MKQFSQARLIDRSIRPLFPKAFKNEVQVIVTVLSVDAENEADILALNAVSAALAISRIPWNGPIAAIVWDMLKRVKARRQHSSKSNNNRSRTFNS